MKKGIILLTGFIVLLLGCRKYNILPDVSTNGYNTFGCTTNGKLFVPRGGFAIVPLQASFRITSKGIYHFRLDASNVIYDTPARAMMLFIDSLPFKSGDRLTFNPIGTHASATAIFYYGLDLKSYTVIPSPTRQLEILKLDTVNKIIAGQFSFDAVNTMGDTIHVRQGRFDVIYTSYFY